MTTANQEPSRQRKAYCRPIYNNTDRHRNKHFSANNTAPRQPRNDSAPAYASQSIGGGSGKPSVYGPTGHRGWPVRNMLPQLDEWVIR
jgi:hypothetical protein